MNANGEAHPRPSGRALSTIWVGLGLCLWAELCCYFYASGYLDGNVQWLIWAYMAALGVWIRLCWKAPHPWPLFALAFQALGLMCVLVSATTTAEATVSLALIVTTAGALLSLLHGALVTLRPAPDRKIQAPLKI